MPKLLTQVVCRLLIVCIFGLSPHVQAALMPTETASPAAAAERQKIDDFFARDDVRKQLEANGVDPQAALERAQALSDDEAKQLAGKIDALPAGGSEILGVLLTIFIVLLVTDILGFTKIFPFTRSIR